MEKLTLEQIMALQPKQKFYVATESHCESYFFVGMNPMTGKPLVVAITSSNYGKSIVLDPESKRCAFFLNYQQALAEFIKMAEEKTSWWKERLNENEKLLTPL